MRFTRNGYIARNVVSAREHPIDPNGRFVTHCDLVLECGHELVNHKVYAHRAVRFAGCRECTVNGGQMVAERKQ